MFIIKNFIIEENSFLILIKDLTSVVMYKQNNNLRNIYRYQKSNN